ncbi:ornithine carbamoyltransferase [Granulicoccus sp. GXG6511]|uniref:ornithine carbamoyltransferase n=1 Tax=Granulicoccus sp. GXG6511 TaxID=3381351 RepID=UPI003D7E4F24
MTLRHFLADDDLTSAEQAEVLALGAEMKAEPFKHRPFEGPRSVAILSDKPTLRTQLSFHAGVAEMGGNPMLVDGRLAGIGVRESIADSAKVLSGHAAAIVWRTGAHERIEKMAEHATVPVVNALTDSFHPCQLLADLLTITERKDRLAGIRFGYVGDGANNVANSYLLGGALAGMHLRIGAPEGYQPDPAIVARATEIAATTGGSVLVTDSPTECVDGADVVATDTWVSMGLEAENEARVAAFSAYQVNAALVAKADRDAIVVHCLPAYRGKEITTDVIEGPQAVVWDEAENRRHAQKAILTFLDRAARGS